MPQPVFDPNQPFVEEQPRFDPTKPFVEESQIQEMNLTKPQLDQPSFGQRILGFLNQPTPQAPEFLQRPVVRLPQIVDNKTLNFPTPLTDIKIPIGTHETPIERAGIAGLNRVAQNIEGLTTVPNVLMAAGTGGEGLLAQFLRPLLVSKFGTDILGTDLPRALGEASVKLLPKFLGGSSESFTKEEQGQTSADVLSNTILGLLLGRQAKPIETLRTPSQPRLQGVPDFRTPQDKYEAYPQRGPERQLVSPETAQANVDQALAERVAREVMIRQRGEGRTVQENVPPVQLPQGFQVEPYPPSRQIEAPGVAEARYTEGVEQTQAKEAQIRESQRVVQQRPIGGRQPQGLQLKPTEEQIRRQKQEGAINLQGPIDVLKEFKAKVMDGTQILNRLKNKLHPDEWKIYEDAGIVGAFGGKKVDPKDVATWMKENGPRVEVRVGKLGEGQKQRQEVINAEREMNAMQHQLETKGFEVNQDNGPFFGSLRNRETGSIYVKQGNVLYIYDKNEKLSNQISFDQVESSDPQMARFFKAKERFEQIGRTQEPGTDVHWSSIAPKPESDMPGYVEGAVVVPQRKLTFEEFRAKYPEGPEFVLRDRYDKNDALAFEKPLQGGTHSFPNNTLAFFRGYMETTPKGKKVFHVIEVQSDWAQGVRASREQAQQRGLTPDEWYQQEARRGYPNERAPREHPLLRQYERLALKAAIEHAKAEGADAIAVSDAETAMMTEGHDLAQQVPPEQLSELNRARIEGEISINEYHDRLAEARRQAPITQAPGMRLHYDRTLPGILEELTGQKGEKVAFGEHKMAHSELARDEYGHQPPAGSQIFKEPTGEPKTSVTAKSFSLDKVSSTDFTAFGKDRPTTPVSEAAKFRAPSGKGLQLKPTEEQQRLRSQEGGGFGYRTYRKDVERTGYRPVSAPSTQRVNKSDRAKAILANPTAKPLETRPEYRAQPGERTSFGRAILNRITAAQNTAGKADKLLLPIDVVIDDLDGGQAKYTGTLMQQVRWPLDDDFNNELQRRDSYIDPVVNLVKKGKLNKQNGERIGVYAIAQQEGGVQRLLDSGMSQGTIDKILGSITPAELSVYKEMRKQMDATLPEVQRLAKELYGTDVKPVPNYFPFKRDWEIFEPEAEEVAGPKVGKESTPDIVAWRELAQDYGKRGTKAEQGFTIQRKPNAKTGIKVNAFEIYDRHMRDVAHFLSMQKNLKEIGEIVRADDFKQKYGDRGQQLVLDWLNTVAKQGRYKRNMVLDTIRKNIAKGIIAFRIPSQLVHLANVPLAQERAGLVWHSRGMEASLSDEGQAFLHKYFGETFERGGGEEALQEASRGPITRAGFFIQKELDRVNAQATVLGVYMKRLQEKGLNPQQFDTLPVDKDAVREARVLARRAVASPLYKDVPLALTKGGSGAKFFFQFQNTFLDQWSNIRYDLVQAGLGKNFVNNPKLAAKMTLAVGMMLLVETGIKYGSKQAINKLTGREDRKDDTFSGTLFHEATRRVPGMGQVLSAIQYGETGVPGADVALEAAKATKQAIKAESSKERVLATTRAVTAVGELAGVPGVSQVSDIAQAKMKSEMFKTHQQRLEEVGGKPLNKMSLDERAKAEVEVKKQRGPQSRSDSAKGAATAIRNNEKRGEELQASLDPKIQRWLDEKKIRIPGYTDSIPYQKQEIVLTKAEQARYKEILTEKYNKFLSPWVGTTPSKEALSGRTQQVHAQAKTQLLNEIRSNSISESDEKPKKKRFSFMGSE